MCDTSTISNAGMGAQIGGTLMQVFGAYDSASAQKRAYAAQSRMAANNAMIAEYAAQDALLRGQKNIDTIRLQAAGLKGTQRASLSARGIDLGEGSALDILTSTDFMSSRDVATATDNAAKEAWGNRVQAANYRANADIYSSAAETVSPLASAAGTLLTGAGQVAQSWYRLKNPASALKYAAGNNPDEWY